MSKKTDFKALKAKWDKKLADSGFEDIETANGDLKRHTAYGSRGLGYHGQIGWDAKVSYYTMAEHFLNDYRFDTNMDKVIWEYHANGISVREIAQLLQDLKLVDTISRGTVHNILKKLTKSMYAMYVGQHDEYHE